MSDVSENVDIGRLDHRLGRFLTIKDGWRDRTGQEIIMVVSADIRFGAE